MDITCVVLAGAALTFAFLWRLERTWFLARDAGCFCRRRRDGGIGINPDGCPVHSPETWLRHCEALFHSDFGRLMEKEILQEEPRPPSRPRRGLWPGQGRPGAGQSAEDN